MPRYVCRNGKVVRATPKSKPGPSAKKGYVVAKSIAQARSKMAGAGRCGLKKKSTRRVGRRTGRRVGRRSRLPPRDSKGRFVKRGSKRVARKRTYGKKRVAVCRKYKKVGGKRKCAKKGYTYRKKRVAKKPARKTVRVCRKYKTVNGKKKCVRMGRRMK